MDATKEYNRQMSEIEKKLCKALSQAVYNNQAVLAMKIRMMLANHRGNVVRQQQGEIYV